jgi:hypothetical protein
MMAHSDNKARMGAMMNQQFTLTRVFLLFSLIFLTLNGCVPSTTDVSSNENQEIEGETRIYGTEDEASNEEGSISSEEEASPTDVSSNENQEIEGETQIYGTEDEQSNEEESSSSAEEAVEGSSRSLDGASDIIYEGEHTIYVGDQAILDAFAEERSDILIDVAGEVERVLSDDLEGSRHQRFILRLADNHTVLVAHNIDLAAKVPLQEGDWIELRGEYEWNQQGGVIHWTHHDPDGRHLDGWILYNDEYYE